jgi:protein tyrosine phosphatase
MVLCWCIDPINQHIINLRMGEDDTRQFEKVKDPQGDGSVPQVDWIHLAIPNKYDKYHTDTAEVREWLTDTMKLFEKKDDNIKFPVLVHCRAGKDRTGVVVATLLKILGVEEDIIQREFLLCPGADIANLQRTLKGFNDKRTMELYFRKKVKVNRVKANFV